MQPCSAYAASKASGAYISGDTCGAAPRTGFSGLPGFFSTTASTVLPFLIVAVVAVLVIALVRWVATGAKLPSLAQFDALGRHLPDRGVLTEKAGVMRQLAEDYSGTRIDEGCVEVSIVEQSSG